MSKDYGADIAQSVEKIEGTWEIDGQGYALLTEDVQKRTLDLIQQYAERAEQAASGEDIDASDLPPFPWEDDDDERDMVESVINAKLIKPEVDVEQVPMRKLGALFEGMMDTWASGIKVDEATDEMPLNEGNGQTSPNALNKP